MRQRSKRLWAVRKDQRAQCTHLIEQAELQALPGDGARADEHSSSPATCCARDTVATTPSITGGGGVDDADVEVLDEQDDAVVHRLRYAGPACCARRSSVAMPRAS
jgi:hypothetical protein